MATAGVALVVLGPGAAAVGGGAAAAGGAVAGGNFIAESFIVGGGAAAAAGGAAAGGGAAGVGSGAAATGGLLAVGGTIGAIGTAIVTAEVKAMERAAVISLGAIKDGIEAIRDDEEGIPHPENSEEKQLRYTAIIIDEFHAD